MLYRPGFELATLVVIGTDYIGSYKLLYDHHQDGSYMQKKKRKIENIFCNNSHFILCSVCQKLSAIDIDKS